MHPRTDNTRAKFGNKIAVINSKNMNRVIIGID